MTGRQDHHIFEIERSFAIWYDSPTSLRVYVFARNDYEEIYTTDRIYVPLNEWINIQVTISASKGITAMTFNQNGDMLQLVNMDVRLGQQYPSATMNLF